MDITKIKNNLVVSSNDLVHAKYDLTLWQKRVFVYAISQLKKDDMDFEPIKMNVSDIIKFFKGSDGIKTYNAILEAPKNLDKTIEIPYITDKGFLRYGFIKLLQKYTIPADDQSENQYIEICFNNDLKPHLLELKEKFLKYDIRNVIELQSTYSFRMFEILKTYEFRKNKIVELEIDYLRKILEVTDKYKSYKDFRIYIIDKAMEDLTKYCDITFTYEAKKATKGKKIESIIFHIIKNDVHERNTKNDKTVDKKEKSTETIKPEYFYVTSPNKEESTVNSGHVSDISAILETEIDSDKLVLTLSPIVVSQFGVSLKVFMNLADTHTEGEIRQAIEVTQKAIEAGKVGNAAGFFVEALRGKYTDTKQKTKQIEVAQKAKLAENKRVEEATEKQLKKQKQAIYEQEAKIFAQLIAEEPDLIAVFIDKVCSGMFGVYYKSDKPFEENLANPLLKAAFLNVAKEAKPDKFKLV